MDYLYLIDLVATVASITGKLFQHACIGSFESQVLETNDSNDSSDSSDPSDNVN